MSAYAYLRVSGPDQVNGDGFPRQRAYIEAYAAREGVTIAGWYQEQVQGWRDTDERVALAQLFEDAAEQGVKIVLFEALHRLARDLLIQESILGDMKSKRGLTPVSVTEPDLCGNEPTRVLMRQMLGAFNQYEKTMIVAKLKGARERMKAATGRCEGRKPYGQTNAERLVIARILQLREQGRTIRQVAAALNNENAPTREVGARWQPTQVHRILHR